MTRAPGAEVWAFEAPLRGMGGCVCKYAHPTEAAHRAPLRPLGRVCILAHATLPLKHQLADSPGQWPWSSFQRFAALGWIPAEWRGPEDPNVLGDVPEFE